MSAAAAGRPRLLLFVARYQYLPKNALAATFAWAAEQSGWFFEVYYDTFRAGRHYGGGNLGRFGLLPGRDDELGLLSGGLMAGGRHVEALSLALQRFETTVVCAGEVAFANTLAALAQESGTAVHVFDEHDVVGLHGRVFSALDLRWPETAVMLNALPSVQLEGVDAYLWPEVFDRRALGVEMSLDDAQLASLRDRGVREVLTCCVPAARRTALSELGFRVEDLCVAAEGEGYAAVTARVAKRWQDHRRGWIMGDPVLASSWLPAACREGRAVIYGVPQTQVLGLLKDELAGERQSPILGRQYDDSDFFELSKLGHALQVVDPCRPPLPVTLCLPSSWSSRIPSPTADDPTDQELLAFAREGRVLVSLVFWTGMIRETENLFALMDLFALTGLRAGIVLTAQSFAYRPSPLDLLTVPRAQGGVYPNVEVLLGSCGTGVAIESLLGPKRLRGHLRAAQRMLQELGVPEAWRPKGWWSTMDVPLVPLEPGQRPRPVRWNSSSPYRFQVRFHPPAASSAAPSRTTAVWQRRFRDRLRGSSLRQLFSAYRPYENFGPGPLAPELARTVHQAGFDYMLTKAGFGRPPRVLYREHDFVALNYTAGNWDGWTPFETVSHVRDLARAEKRLLRRRQPGWLLGTIDTCLWAFSGELWRAAPELAAIARFAAAGGASSQLVNVPPRVLARYARLTQ